VNVDNFSAGEIAQLEKLVVQSLQEDARAITLMDDLALVMNTMRQDATIRQNVSTAIDLLIEHQQHNLDLNGAFTTFSNVVAQWYQAPLDVPGVTQENVASVLSNLFVDDPLSVQLMNNALEWAESNPEASDAQKVYHSFLNGYDNEVDAVSAITYITWDQEADNPTDTSDDFWSVETNFSHGNRSQDVETFGSNFDLINNGLLWTTGNATVTSQTANTAGFFVELNAAISDGHQPGRSNIIETTASEEVAKLWDPLDQSNYGLLDLDVDETNFALSYVTDWATGIAEIDPLVLDLDGDGIELTPFADR
ncbi:hypothetical protein, partial [Pseudovibrio sp. POLY-S9]|uniref:hypothetical protein n=1 Tax=Pseudovibrio sp. POLY-S9 TaxID=1576596 RepID=UPI000AAD1A61